ncbi:hypothetical protein D3C86_1619830 [compost metagenome]
MLRPTPLIETLAELTAFVPIGRTHPGNADHVTGPRNARLILFDDPLFKLGQRLDFIQQVRAHAVEGRHHWVTVGIDHARHQHLARQIDTLRASTGQGVDLGIGARFENLAVLHGHCLDQSLTGFGGEYLAVEQHQVSGGHRRHRGQSQGCGQQSGNESLHRNSLLFLLG